MPADFEVRGINTSLLDRAWSRSMGGILPPFLVLAPLILLLLLLFYRPVSAIYSSFAACPSLSSLARVIVRRHSWHFILLDLKVRAPRSRAPLVVGYTCSRSTAAAVCCIRCVAPNQTDRGTRGHCGIFASYIFIFLLHLFFPVLFILHSFFIHTSLSLSLSLSNRWLSDARLHVATDTRDVC